MKRITARQLLSLLISLMLVIGVIPFSAVTAYAANAANEAALVKAVNNGGDVKLTKDIALTDVLRIPNGVTVTLDLNGKTLDRGLTKCVDLGSVIRVEPGGTLTIKDGSDTNAGLITGGASWNGGGICNHGTLTVEGGTISGNKSIHIPYGGGGGISNGGTLSFEGGTIVGNTATENGGGIYNTGNVPFAAALSKITKRKAAQAYITKPEPLLLKRRKLQRRSVLSRSRPLITLQLPTILQKIHQAVSITLPGLKSATSRRYTTTKKATYIFLRERR